MSNKNLRGKLIIDDDTEEKILDLENKVNEDVS